MKNRTIIINNDISAILFQDKGTKQFVLYIPSLEITGYGATEKKAMEMLKYSIADYYAWAGKNC